MVLHVRSTELFFSYNFFSSILLCTVYFKCKRKMQVLMRKNGNSSTIIYSDYYCNCVRRHVFCVIYVDVKLKK